MKRLTRIVCTVGLMSGLMSTAAPLAAQVLFSDGFESGSASAWDGTRTDDVPATYPSENCRSGRRCGAMTLTGSGPQKSVLWFKALRHEGRQFYGSAWLRFPVNYSWYPHRNAQHNTEHKLFIISAGDAGVGRMLLNLREGGTTPTLQIHFERLERLGSGISEFTSTQWPADGAWHHLEFLIDRVSGANARARIWLDGRPALDRTGRVCGDPCHPVTGVEVGAFVNQGSTRRQTFYVDDVVFAASRTSSPTPNPDPSDSVPPTVSLNNVRGGETISGTRAINAEARDNVRVAGVQFRLDSRNLGGERTAAPYSINWNTTTVANGSHTLSAVARDAAGNTTESARLTVNVNNGGGSPPGLPGTVSDLRVTGAGARSVTLTFTQTHDGNSQPAKYDVRYARGATINWGSAPSVTSGTCATPVAGGEAGTSRSCTVQGLEAGAEYRFQLIAFRGTLNQDARFGTLSNVAAGRTGDTAAPTVSMRAPQNGATVSGKSVQVSANAADDDRIAAVQFKVDGANLGREVTSSPYTVTWDTTVLSDGEHALTAVARDASGNTTTSASRTVKVNNGSANGSVLLEENFEDGNLSGRGWYDNVSPPLSTEQHIPGSSRSAQFRFPRGATAPVAGGAMRHRFTPSESVYLRYYVKHSANWVGSGKPYHPHQFHFLTTLDDQWSGLTTNRLNVYVETNGGTPLLQIQDSRNIDQSQIGADLTRVTEQRALGGCNGDADGHGAGQCYPGSGGLHHNGKIWKPRQAWFLDQPGPRYKGDWHKVEAYFKLNSIVNGKGVANGEIRYLYDGQEVLAFDNVMFRTAANAGMKFNQFVIAPHIGDGSPADQTFWVDDLLIATAPPSAGPSQPGLPGQVTIASATATSADTVTLTFTEVDDGTARRLPASYDVRIAAGPINWGSADSVAQGTCTTPLAGTQVGAVRRCTITGLAAGTTYQFQLIAFRGVLNSNAEFGRLSNIVVATTPAAARR